jgi:hypothetical protein
MPGEHAIHLVVKRRQPFHVFIQAILCLTTVLTFVMRVTGQFWVLATNTVFLNRLLPGTFPGREKGVCDQAPEASADLSDFQSLP